MSKFTKDETIQILQKALQVMKKKFDEDEVKTLKALSRHNTSAMEMKCCLDNFAENKQYLKQLEDCLPPIESGEVEYHNIIESFRFKNCSSILDTFVEAQDLAMTQFLLQKGFNANSVSGFNTPLITSFNNDEIVQIDMMKLLISHKANVNYNERGAYTPLFHAVVSGRKNAIKLLLCKGADINISTERTTTLLKILKQFHSPSKHAKFLELCMQDTVTIENMDDADASCAKNTKRFVQDPIALCKKRQELTEVLLKSPNAIVNMDDEDADCVIEALQKAQCLIPTQRPIVLCDQKQEAIDLLIESNKANILQKFCHEIAGTSIEENLLSRLCDFYGDGYDEDIDISGGAAASATD